MYQNKIKNITKYNIKHNKSRHKCNGLSSLLALLHERRKLSVGQGSGACALDTAFPCFPFVAVHFFIFAIHTARYGYLRDQRAEIASEKRVCLGA